MKSAVFGIFSALCDFSGIQCELRELIIKTFLITDNDSSSITASGIQALAAKMISQKKDIFQFEFFLMLFNEALAYESSFENIPAIKRDSLEISEILPLVYESVSNSLPDEAI